jgi:hypothetical protein
MESPCVSCLKYNECKDGCALYRFYVSTLSETSFNKEVIRAISAIKAADPIDED